MWVVYYFKLCQSFFALVYFHNFNPVAERNLLEVQKKPPQKATQKQPIKSTPSSSNPKKAKKSNSSPPVPSKPEIEKSAKLNPVHLKRVPQVKAKPKVVKVRELTPTYEDHDCDGIPDDEDDDVDNDGLLDRTQDSDWDGLLNHVDDDDDNDG